MYIQLLTATYKRKISRKYAIKYESVARRHLETVGLVNRLFPEAAVAENDIKHKIIWCGRKIKNGE